MVITECFILFSVFLNACPETFITEKFRIAGKNSAYILNDEGHNLDKIIFTIFPRIPPPNFPKPLSSHF